MLKELADMWLGDTRLGGKNLFSGKFSKVFLGGEIFKTGMCN
jgi:hypothetical protein